MCRYPIGDKVYIFPETRIVQSRILLDSAKQRIFTKVAADANFRTKILRAYAVLQINLQVSHSIKVGPSPLLALEAAS